MIAATPSTAAPSNQQRPFWPLLLLALAGPAWGQPAPVAVNAIPVPVTDIGFPALDAELPAPLRLTLALFATLDEPGRRAIAALLPWLPDGRAGAFFTTLARAPTNEQAAAIRLLPRLNDEQAMGTGIVLQAFGEASWPAFFTFESALPDHAPFNPSNRREGCLAIATTVDGVDVCNGDSGPACAAGCHKIRFAIASSL